MAARRAASARPPKPGRLSRSADFDRVYRQGRSHGSRELVLHVFPTGAGEDGGMVTVPRVGLSVSRRVGGAVARNRVKRLLREAFAAEGHAIPPGHDVVLVARPPLADVVERDGLPGVRGVLVRLLAEAGLRASTSEGP